MSSQKDIIRKIYLIGDAVLNHKMNLRFSGFILYGPPGNGKTEIARQSARLLAQNNSVDIYFIDGTDIATPKWGEAEEKLKNIFSVSTENKDPNRGKIIILDDIESTMLGRSADIAKEWHFSINSVLFHSLDNQLEQPMKFLVIGTSNRIDLVDKALLSRLYPIEIKSPNVEQMQEFLKLALEENNLLLGNESLINKVSEKIRIGEISDYRGIEHSILEEYVSQMEKELYG